MQHDRVFDEKTNVDHQYITFDADTELRQNSLHRDIIATSQISGNHFKGKMEKRQPFSLLAFAIQHGKPYGDPAVKWKLVNLP